MSLTVCEIFRCSDTACYIVEPAHGDYQLRVCRRCKDEMVALYDYEVKLVEPINP